MNDISPIKSEQRYRLALWVIIALAAAIRIIPAIISDNLSHPDENFQILEQAHRLVFGYGVIPWEFHVSARSWIIPGLMAVMLYPFKLFGIDNPDLYIPSLKIILSLISLIVVYSAYRIGQRLSGPKAGLGAAFFCAVWYEIAYFSIRPLSEVWAATFFLAALALALNRENRLQTAAAGVLMILTLAVRIHFFPAVLILAVMIVVSRRNRPWKSLAMSILLTLIAVGLFETITLGGPFISYVNYFKFSGGYSLAEAAAAGPFDFALMLGYGSFFVGWLFLLLGLLKWRRLINPILIVLAILLTHSVIPLKEHLVSLRFIYPVIPLLMIIGAVAMADLTERISTPGRRRMVRTAIVLSFVALSAAGAAGILPGQKNVYDHHIFHQDPRLRAGRFLHHEADIHAVFDNSGFWFESGGYYYLHRDLPLYYNATQPPSADYVSHILNDEDIPWQGDFALLKRIEEIRIYRRVERNVPYKSSPDYSRNMF